MDTELARFIFVAGTGRSGTHLVGRTIGSHADVEARIEKPLTFRMLTHLATHQDCGWGPRLAIEERLLTLIYKAIGALSRKPFVMEKSHPSLWLAERLLHSLDRSVFLAVWRDPEPTVASMLRHGGVLSWYRKLPTNVENRFLGITSQNKDSFNDLQIEEKCTLRWLSHKREIDRLRTAFPDRVLSVKYDDFVTKRSNALHKISSFLGIENQYDPEALEIESLSRWKHELDASQIQTIRDTILRYSSYGANALQCG